MAFFCFLRSVAGATPSEEVGTRESMPLERARRSQSSRRRDVLGGREEATIVSFKVVRRKDSREVARKC